VLVAHAIDEEPGSGLIEVLAPASGDAGPEIVYLLLERS
jgi:hypothetical protein